MSEEFVRVGCDSKNCTNILWVNKENYEGYAFCNDHFGKGKCVDLTHWDKALKEYFNGRKDNGKRSMGTGRESKEVS